MELGAYLKADHGPASLYFRKVLCARNHLAAVGRCGEGEGHLGALLPHAAGQQQLDQNGSRYRGLLAYRV